MFVFLLQLFFLVACILFFFWMLFSLFAIVKGAPFICSRYEVVDTMVRLSAIQPGECSVDIGSGSGRVVFAFARAGACAYGYEINLLLLLWSRFMSFILGLRGRAFFRWRNFWWVDFSSFDVVTVYGIPFIMQDLECKLLRELKPGSRILSHAFRFPSLEPTVSEGFVFLYIVPDCL